MTKIIKSIDDLREIEKRMDSIPSIVKDLSKLYRDMKSLVESVRYYVFKDQL